jgi:hypothetical protein
MSLNAQQSKGNGYQSIGLLKVRRQLREHAITMEHHTTARSAW